MKDASEKEKAYQAWAKSPSGLWRTFYAGWVAKTNTMNSETEFEKWWAHSPVIYFCEQHKGKLVWDAAYTAGRLVESANADNAHTRGRADERAEIERKLLAMAGQAFVANRDDHAHWFRSLVNVLFKKP